ncbi:MAG: serpin family protein [Deltaproteobacteria bacterium]|nr:serpin family protein [Deltaproteobacteria bacterium]
MRRVTMGTAGMWTAAALAFLAGCGDGGGGGGGGSSSSGGAAPGSEVRSSLPRVTSPIVSADDRTALAAGNRAFATSLFQRLRSSGANVFFSPHSISEALAMAYAGARGTTASQMETALHYSLGQAGLHNAFNELDLALASRGQNAQSDAGVPFRLRAVNATWGQSGYAFEPAFLDVMAANYGAGLRVLDYATDPDGSRQVINGWVSEQTEQKIPELIAPGLLTTSTRLVLTNAIYFHAAWAEPFDPEDTVQRPFTNADATTANVDMVVGRRALNAGTGNGFTGVEIPYDGRELSMVVLRPDAGRFDDVEAALDAPFLSAIIAGMTHQDVDLKLPKFRLEYSANLADTLKALGMTDAFDSSTADFTGITVQEQLFISDVVHKSFIGVDEKGTEAAAATAVVFAGSGVPTDVLDFEVNRPFIFLIRDLQTGAILFMGRITQLG